MSVGPMHASRWARVVLDELELDLSTHAAHLLETLAHIADEQGEAWPSLARLMHRMRLGRTSVTDARAELVAAGLVIAVGGQRGGRRASGAGVTSRYRLALSVVPNRPPRRTVDDVDAVPNRPPGRREPSAPADAKSHEVPLVLTNANAVTRGAAPPWVSEGISYGVWARRERRAGRLGNYQRSPT